MLHRPIETTTQSGQPNDCRLFPLLSLIVIFLNRAHGTMSILYHFFPPAEVKVCLRTLKEIRPIFSHLLYSNSVLERVRGILLDKKNKPELLEAIYEDKNSPRDLVLSVIVQHCMLRLSTGMHHVYRGVLSGEGNGMRAVFEIAVKELVKSNFYDEDEASTQREVLQGLIKKAG